MNQSTNANLTGADDGSRRCPPCNGQCRQGRDCPWIGDEDPLAAARGIVWAVLMTVASFGAAFVVVLGLEALR